MEAYPMHLRIGLHTGEVHKVGNSVTGLSVHIAECVLCQAGAGEIVISGAVRDLVAGGGFSLVDRGLHTFIVLRLHYH
jgi:class 3 adenylate cyclase